MYEERDKFLTEAMGECWHEFNSIALWDCKNCGKEIPEISFNVEFSTPAGFFKLWNWAKEQYWWEEFCIEGDFPRPWGSGLIPPECSDSYSWIDAMVSMVNPNNCANALYKFLKEKQNG